MQKSIKLTSQTAIKWDRRIFSIFNFLIFSLISHNPKNKYDFKEEVA